LIQSIDTAEPPRVSSPYPPLYIPFKVVSPRLALALRDSPLSSNAVTITWALLLVAASVVLAFQHALLALFLVMLAILLDCLDGDLARCRNQPSISGTLLEQLAHWIGNMGLMAGVGAAILLADPKPGNVLLASMLAVVQSVYIAVVRQVRPEAANIPEHPLVCRAFRVIIKVNWNLSPIELPLVGALVAFGVTETLVLAITVALAVSSALIFVPHFILIRARDRRQWVMTDHRSDPLADLSSRYAAAILLTHFPVARWWTPGAPQLPSEVLTLMGRPPMDSGAPVLASAWRDLAALLPQLFRTSGRVLPLACPTEAALEAVIGTFCQPADEILVVGGRATILRWRTIAERLGVRVSHIEVPFGTSLPSSDLEAALTQHATVRAVCLPLSQVEDGGLTDLAGTAETLATVPGLVMVDACLGLCADDLHMDEWGIDIAVSSSDSGVMAPPGLSLVALGPRALEALDQPATGADSSGTYLDLRTHIAHTDRPVAPLPAPGLGGLYVSVQMIVSVGLDTILAHRRQVAERFRRGCVEEAGLKLVASHPSAACTVAFLPGDVPLAELQESIFAALRMVVASGSTPDGATALRFGHAGWLFQDDIDQAVEALAVAVRTARAETRVQTSRSSS
jgi:aspartate aminotransferase-like enzyme/phosphatidylglycerophosphate synthase